MNDVISSLDNLIERYPQLIVCKNQICDAYKMLRDSFQFGGKLLIAGNGGSETDAEHIVGELMKSFHKERKLDTVFQQRMRDVDAEFGNILAEGLQGTLPAIALGAHSGLNTAWINDCNPDLCFAQQVNGYGNSSDVFFAISTSGNSKNVIYAVVTAKAKGMKIIALTGSKDSKLSELCDVCIRVPESETYKVQELHLPVYHCLCLMLEKYFFN